MHCRVSPRGEFALVEERFLLTGLTLVVFVDRRAGSAFRGKTRLTGHARLLNN